MYNFASYNLLTKVLEDFLSVIYLLNLRLKHATKSFTKPLAIIIKQTFSILIIFLISISGFAQCEDIDKLELDGTYRSRTRNDIPF